MHGRDRARDLPVPVRDLRDDPTVRENRHAFLAGVYRLFGHYADFLVLQERSLTG